MWRPSDGCGCAGNKEKVMRISLMSLQRLVATGAEEPQSAMVEAGLPRIIRIRSAQTWSDEDIPELLESLDESLNTSVAAMSSWEKYRAEVLSGSLDWTPMHTNKQFWVVRIPHTATSSFCWAVVYCACPQISRVLCCAVLRCAGSIEGRLYAQLSHSSELCFRGVRQLAVAGGWFGNVQCGVQENVKATEDKDFQIIRCLIKLLETSQDPKVLAVACHDLGVIAETLPQGRFIINNLRGKAPVMAQMANKNPDVSKHALVCVQRLMLGKDKLEFLSRPAGSVS